MESSHDNSCFFLFNKMTCYKKIFWKKRVLEKHVREGERLIKKKKNTAFVKIALAISIYLVNSGR